MKIIYDQAANTLKIILTENPIAESDEDKPGVILDYDDKGNLVLNSRSKDKSKLKASRPNFSQANRYDYISRKTSSGKIELITDESERFENFLQTKRGDTLTGVMVNPWGCVFGLRSSAGNWTFTLQRNATVLYKRKTIKKGTINSVNCTTLGHTKFFPGKNEIHYRAIESIQVY